MPKPVLLLLLIISPFPAFAQEISITDSLPRVATVDVTVTDTKAKARKGEEVLFRGENTGKVFTAISDVNGKIKQLLPPGDIYHVSVKSISDTTSYAVLNVPALGEGEYFTESFWVKIKIDPPKQYRLDDVHFDFDKSTLRQDSYSQLSELLEYLQRREDVNIEIAGHTDNVGADDHNLKLSQERANTIRDYLIRKGIKASKLIAKGYGSTEPVADNGTEEGRQLNRRTEVRIIE